MVKQHAKRRRVAGPDYNIGESVTVKVPLDDRRHCTTSATRLLCKVIEKTGTPGRYMYRIRYVWSWLTHCIVDG